MKNKNHLSRSVSWQIFTLRQTYWMSSTYAYCSILSEPSCCNFQ